jgi:hypothetical protein
MCPRVVQVERSLSTWWRKWLPPSWLPAVHKFSKTLGTTSNFYMPDGWHEENSILRTTNIRHHHIKVCCHGDMAPQICAPLLFIMQFAPASCYWLPPWPKYSPHYLVLKILSLSSSLHVKCKVSHPHKTTGKIMVLCILIFIISHSRWSSFIYWVDSY